MNAACLKPIFEMTNREIDEMCSDLIDDLQTAQDLRDFNNVQYLLDAVLEEQDARRFQMAPF
ncbi:MAG: hypothetical protein QF787_06360 [Nitrospinota bacterium]|jgi:hypothetical protein|nr:hypothetical protein [Nitrospinota bacterium]|tara:strand:- start:701 stop:886 length:186 start_codon:yes stop_codon:yes gene_type:complete